MREPVLIKNQYFGMTYPHFLSKGIFGYLWKRFCCVKNKHLFDECWTIDGHCLVCDVCQLTVEIKHIDIAYLNCEILDLKRIDRT